MITAPASFTSANAALAKKPIVAFEIDGYNRVFTNRPTGVDQHYDWITEISDLTFEVTPLDGTCQLDDLTVTVEDHDRSLTADYPALTLEGRTCRLKTGFPGQPYSEFVTLFTGKLDSIPTSNKNLTYDFIAKDTRLDLKQLVYLTGDDGQPTDNDHPKTLLGHPLDIVESVLIDYLGIDPSLVDLDKLHAYRDEIFAGSIFEFSITSPPEAKAFLESQIFKPLGGYLRSNNLGKLTPHFFLPLGGSIVPAMTLNRDNIVGTPEIQQADLVNAISFRFDKQEDKFTSEAVRLMQVSIDKYGLQGQNIVESDGMRSGYQGFYLAQLVSNAVFARYGDKNPKVEVQGLWSTCLLEPGDLSLVTHSLMPDRKAGVMGLTNKLFEIEGMSLSFADFTTRFSLVDAGTLTTYGAYRIASGGKPSWTSATEGDRARYMYISGADGKYSDGTTAHNLG